MTLSSLFTRHSALLSELAALEKHNGEFYGARWKPRLQSRKLSQFSGTRPISRNVECEKWRTLAALPRLLANQFGGSFAICANRGLRKTGFF
jgi:hypothetical protein